jgi:GntR family transcriptional regulator, transcriptional repressor for pyruvate dehydrogenase complex
MSKPDHTARQSKADQIAQVLVGRILDEGLEPGDSLGTEASLLAAHDISRPTLRESLRMLEAQGVVALRPGPGGGAIVRRPSIGSLAHALSVFLYLHKTPFGTVLKARELIEPALAWEAALHGAESDFAAMEASIARMRDCAGHEAFVAENRVFHEIIARASGNVVLESFWSAISLLASGERHGILYSFGNRRHVTDAHAAILAACRARDAAAASALMAAHVGELEHLVRRRYQFLLDEPTQVMRRDGAGRQMPLKTIQEAS